MAIENKKMILLEDIKGNREIAYALLEASHPLFSNYKITIVDESLLLENEIELGDYDWNKFKDLTTEEKLRNLISIGLLYDELKNSKYTYELTPDNLIFTINGSVKILNRGIKGQIMPYENISNEDFLNSYKCMIISLLDLKTYYEALKNGKLQFYKGNLFCENIRQAETIDEVLKLLKERYLNEKQENQEEYYRVNKKSFKKWKISSIVFILTTVSLIIALLYLSFFSLRIQNNISSMRLSFIQKDYSNVISLSKNQNSKSLSQEDKYIVAYSVIMTEPLSDKQKNELSNISMKSNEEYLRYWVLIGQANIDEAINVASFLDDPQLIMYGITKKIDEIKSNPKLSAEERTEKINGYKTKLEELKKKYLVPSSDENKNNKKSDENKNNEESKDTKN
ncbi:type VII secretion protein EssB [Parvimonas micra]|uniref:type VII secretion protein EssB n=1 Tax=Parvimonas micra TaxID=33033 RepID=UPI0022B5F39A|nr:type VII secretion protein EssB [Parvimonas micra]WBB32005.1 type VII secretion protein EssB [Parvimonas micra]WBB33493.1 type VII secretion protein EssB [Parvimonas micra]WBB35014.1 type VII secretion protein EssB [Parvimonas micra]